MFLEKDFKIKYNIHFQIIKYILILFLIITFKLSPNLNNIIGINIFLFHFGYLYFFNPSKIIENFFFFLILIPMLLGGFLLEINPTFLFEINRVSYPNGAFLKNLIFYFLFLEFLLKDTYVIKKETSIIKIDFKFIEVITIISILIVYSYFIKTGIPLFKGIHRTNYFGTMVPYYINFTKGRFNFICLCNGLLFYKTKSKRFVFYWILIILYYILCSVKGGDIIGMIWYFFLPVILLSQYENSETNINSSIRKYLIIFLISSLSLLYIGYKKYENYNKKTTPIEKIIKRFEASGQLWWFFTDSNLISQEYRFDKFTDNFNFKKSKFDKGMNQLMTEVLPKDKLKELRKPGAKYYSLSNGFPTLGYFHFGYLGAFSFVVLMGIFIKKLKSLVLKSSLSNDVISLFILSFFLERSVSIVAQGDYYLFFTKRMLIVIILAIIYKLFLKLGVKNGKKLFSFMEL